MIVGYHTGGLDEADVARAARRLQKAGYGGVQFAGPVAKTIAARGAWEESGSIFRAHGIEVLCTWGANPALEEWADGERGQERFAKLRRCGEEARRAGCASLMLLPEGAAPASPELRRAAGRAFANFARAFHDTTGVRLTLHQHAGSRLESWSEVEEFAAEFDGVSSALIADTAHLTLGGIDPARFVRAFAGRIDMLHLKDARAGRFAFPGQGTVDFAAVFAALEAAGFAGNLVADVHDASFEGDKVIAAKAWLDGIMAVPVQP
ncbi:MAG: sugar phosphate isomerase/epimerase [Planctomycetota bacterium]|nr:sugar phosphate isomerase/epimerase [Planctomycetota bacterium]